MTNETVSKCSIYKFLFKVGKFPNTESFPLSETEFDATVSSDDVVFSFKDNKYAAKYNRNNEHEKAEIKIKFTELLVYKFEPIQICSADGLIYEEPLPLHKFLQDTLYNLKNKKYTSGFGNDTLCMTVDRYNAHMEYEYRKRHPHDY